MFTGTALAAPKNARCAHVRILVADHPLYIKKTKAASVRHYRATCNGISKTWGEVHVIGKWRTVRIETSIMLQTAGGKFLGTVESLNRLDVQTKLIATPQKTRVWVILDAYTKGGIHFNDTRHGRPIGSGGVRTGLN